MIPTSLAPRIPSGVFGSGSSMNDMPVGGMSAHGKVVFRQARVHDPSGARVDEVCSAIARP